MNRLRAARRVARWASSADSQNLPLGQQTLIGHMVADAHAGAAIYWLRCTSAEQVGQCMSVDNPETG